MNGFYSPTAWQKQKTPLSLLPKCDACGLYQHCQSPKMPVSGQGKRKVLIIAEAPGRNEDREGIQLVGNAGNELISILSSLGVNMRRDCWLTNAIICRPSDENGENRKPTPKEVNFCRPNLIKTLQKLDPDIIIPLGETSVRSLMSLAWKDSEVDDITTWVGWQIPCQKLNAWICPTYHPSFLLRAKSPVAHLLTTKHLRAAFSHQGKPWRQKPDYTRQVVVCFDSTRAAREVRRFIGSRPVAFDFETTTLKPDGPDAHIICCSVSDGETSLAYPWLGEAIIATKELIASPTPKIASNLRFEDRWVRKHLKVAVNNWVWDTVLGAHWLDCRKKICSLKFQAFVLLGMPDYDSHLASYMEPVGEDKSCNGINRLREVDFATVGLYCGLDSLLEALVAKKQGLEDHLRWLDQQG